MNTFRLDIRFKKIFSPLLLSSCLLVQQPVFSQDPGMVQNSSSPSPVAAQWANRGIDLAAQGDYPAAIESLYEAWKLSPERSGVISNNLSIVYNNYGKLLAEQNKLDEAISNFRKAVFFNTENKTPGVNLDLVLKKKGVNVGDFKTRLTEAQTLRNNGFLDQAVSEYMKAISLAKPGSEEEKKAKLELAQIYQVLYSKYANNPVGENMLTNLLELCKQLTKELGKDPKPYLLMGRAYLVSDKLTEAIDAYENALKITPNDRQALEGLIGAWRRVVDIAPNEANNLLGLASVLFRAGFNEEAKVFVMKAKSIDPNNKEADKLLANSKVVAEEAEIYRVAERALEAQNKGDYDQAIDLYNIAIKKLPPKPENSNVYFNMGLAYQSNNQPTQARQSFQQALKFNPNNKEAQVAIEKLNQAAVIEKNKLTQKAIQLQNDGNFDEAINIYKKLISESPDDAQNHFNLGTAFQQKKMFNNALEEFKTASKLAPGNTEFQSALNTLQEAMTNGALNQSIAEDLLSEAVSLQQAGKISEAIDKYKLALKNNPKSAQAHFNFATALHSANKISEAIQEYKTTYTLDPSGFPEANYFIAGLMDNQQKFSEALVYYKRYLEDQPSGDYSKQAQERVDLLSGSVE
jgi:tetratricopeptide (TPR) repeat protein